MGFFAYFAVAGDNSSADAKTRSCFLAPTAFGLGGSILAKYEGAGAGVTWANFHETPNETEISFAQVLGYMVVDLVLYMFLCFYLDNVVQQEFGIRRPWYFLCSPKYWYGVASQSPGHAAASRMNYDDQTSPPIMEDVSISLKRLEQENRCVRLNGLRKVYQTSNGKHVAVKKMQLDMYEGQIFVLLGHNGAGKTTLLSMLTGLIPPTEGSASVYGNDIRTDMDELRTMIGVCPQYDVLFDELTVKEHLIFFARLKGVADPEQEAELKISEVGLESKANDLSSQLSGGQKRKLSVAIALIGNSKIVFLDEPTSRMDVWARRHTWNLLRNHKNGRIIVLTTHFMDEADILGDRIGIMADGGLECVGSSLFLKSKYGVGYTLTFIQADTKAEAENKDKKRKLIAKVKQYSPAAKVISDVGAEIAIQVPLESSKMFPKLFAEIDTDMKSFGIAGYGASVTTLEEVFMKVGEGANHFSSQVNRNLTGTTGEVRIGTGENCDNVETAANESVEMPADELRIPLLTENDTDAKAESDNVFWIHFSAMFLKRFNYAKRDRKAICCNTLLPVILLVLGLTLLKIFPMKEEPALLLSIEQYSQQETFVPFNSSVNSLDGQRFASSLFAHDTAGVTFVDAEIPVGMNNSCPMSSGSDITDGSNIRGLSEWLLKHAHDNKTSLFGAIQIDNGTSMGSPVQVTILANSTSYHGAGIFLNLVNSLLLNSLNGSSATKASISTSSQPFAFTARFEALLSSFTAVSAAIIIMIAFSFVPAAVAIFIVKENEISAKHQQMISGASIVAYWLASFAWDMCMYMVPWILTCIFVRLFGIDSFQGENLLPVCLLFLGYGFAAIPFTYCLSFLFTSHSTAQNIVLLINFLTGLVSFVLKVRSKIS